MYFVGRTCPRAPVPAAASVLPSSAGRASSHVKSRKNFAAPPDAPPIADYFTMLASHPFSPYPPLLCDTRFCNGDQVPSQAGFVRWSQGLLALSWVSAGIRMPPPRQAGGCLHSP